MLLLLLLLLLLSTRLRYHVNTLLFVTLLTFETDELQTSQITLTSFSPGTAMDPYKYME